MTIEDQFRHWVESLSALDQQFLNDHARDQQLPEKVLDLFRYAPIQYDAWSDSEPPRSFYPRPLLSVLGVIDPEQVAVHGLAP